MKIKFRKLYIDSSQFHESKSVDQLMEEVEKMYIAKLESGDRTRGRNGEDFLLPASPRPEKSFPRFAPPRL